MHRGIMTFLIIFAIMAILAYVALHSRGNAPVTTTVPPGPIPTQNSSSSVTTLNYSEYVHNCTNYSLYTASRNATVVGKCAWGGGVMGVWVAAGDPGSEAATIIGADNVTYLNQSAQYPCMTFYKNVSLPAQTYTITLLSGTGGGTCGYSVVKLNKTTVPPVLVRNFVYNGNFGSGTYTGWNVTGAGFGTAPMNLTHANSNSTNCYRGSEWNGYNGTFFATTFTCGISTSPGNLTSSPFLANATTPFLNFKIISPDDNHIYVEVLEGNVPRIVMHYDTYNSSLGANASSTFRNASIALGRLAGKVLRVRVVSSTLNQFRFIAVGDFALSRTPREQLGIIMNASYNLSS